MRIISAPRSGGRSEEGSRTTTGYHLSSLRDALSLSHEVPGVNETSLLADQTKELAVAGKRIGNLELLVDDHWFPGMIRPVDGHIQAGRKLQGEPGRIRRPRDDNVRSVRLD